MATISCSSSPSSLLFRPVRTLAAPLPPASVSFPPLSHHRGWTRQVKIGASRGVAVVVKAVAEEETEGAVVATSEETVAVPVSPSDLLLMYFKAEGTMEDAAIPSIEKALEAQDGIYDLEVSNSEGVGSVVLTKETTVQATGVASLLVELIQGAGFKLHTLSLSFEDEEDEINEAAIELEDEE